ncbi:hypothetical protein IW150_000625 [Coemansia sp. RSA 2607]|nr:hypothetical protein IW150_000625 [Coemansia sp. RSA 2607]
MQAKGNRAFYQALQASRSAPGNDFIEVDRSIRVKYPKLYHALARQLKDPELADKAFRKGLINLVIDYSSEDESDEDSDMNVSNHEDNAIFYDSLDMEVDEADVSVAISEDADDIAAGAMATRDIATHGHAADEEDNDDDDDSANDDSTDGNVSDNDAPSAMAADDSAASASAASASAASASAASASAASASAASASAASASAASASAASASAASASAPITSAPITSVPITSAPITSAPITTASDDSAPITMAADDSAADDDSVGINVVRNPMSSDNDSDNDSTDDTLTATHYQTVTQDNHRKILKWMYERMRSTPPSEDAINEEACKKKFNKMARAIYRRGRQYVQLCMIAGFHSLDFLLVKLAPTNLDQTTENLVAFESCLIAMGEKFNNQVQTGIDDNFDVLEMARYADYVDGMQEYTRLLHEYSDVAAFIEAFCTYLYT